MGKTNLENFKYFRGCITNEVEPEPNIEYQIDENDIEAQREHVGTLIYMELPIYGPMIKGLIISYANRRRQYNLDNTRFIREEHPHFLELLDHLCTLEESHIADALLFAYYGLLLTDRLDDGDYWVKESIRSLNECLW